MSKRRSRQEPDPFNEGYELASATIAALVEGKPEAVKEFTKAAALCYLTTGYAVMANQEGAAAADKWLDEIMDTAMKDIQKACGIALAFGRIRKGAP